MSFWLPKTKKKPHCGIEHAVAANEFTNHFCSRLQVPGALRILYSVVGARKGDFVLMASDDKSAKADPDLTVTFGHLIDEAGNPIKLRGWLEWISLLENLPEYQKLDCEKLKAKHNPRLIFPLFKYSPDTRLSPIHWMLENWILRYTEGEFWRRSSPILGFCNPKQKLVSL